jgi:hypothetical protein
MRAGQRSHRQYADAKSNREQKCTRCTSSTQYPASPVTYERWSDTEIRDRAESVEPEAQVLYSRGGLRPSTLNALRHLRNLSCPEAYDTPPIETTPKPGTARLGQNREKPAYIDARRGLKLCGMSDEK